MASQVEQLLKYQAEDAKLIEIEKQVNDSPQRKAYVQAKSFLTKAPEKLDQLEAKAIQLGEIMDKLTAKYAEIAETLKDFEHLDELVEGGADISFYKKSASKIGEELKSLREQINNLSASVKAADEEYKTYKKKIISVQNQYNTEISKTYKEYVDGKKAEMSTVKEQLATLAKGIDPEVLKRYEMKRSERIFPIVCALKADRCPQCGMELSLAGKETVNVKGVIECENCHRFLYQEKK